jgi:amidase
MKPLLDLHRDKLKPEVVWNIEKGLALSGADIARAENQRGVIYRRMLSFMEDYDLLLCPSTIVPPFPVEERYVKSCNGVEFTSYVDWLLIVSAITLTTCPALSMPCGFTAGGLPVGLQVVGTPRGEAKLLSAARFIEGVLSLGSFTPIDPKVRH